MEVWTFRNEVQPCLKHEEKAIFNFPFDCPPPDLWGLILPSLLDTQTVQALTLLSSGLWVFRDVSQGTTARMEESSGSKRLLQPQFCQPQLLFYLFIYSFV